MSLVDYGSSSSDDDEPQAPTLQKQEPAVEKIPEKRPRFGVSTSIGSPKSDPHHNRDRASAGPSSKQMAMVSDHSSKLKLPDASLLLNSPAMPSSVPNASDHSSRVAAAMAEGAARKRELKVTAYSYPRSKIPKGNLRNLKNVPDTVAGLLLPPQLIGRSNVVTEDISKLFVKKQCNSSTE